jgi:hypothetical protein
MKIKSWRISLELMNYLTLRMRVYQSQCQRGQSMSGLPGLSTDGRRGPFPARIFPSFLSQTKPSTEDCHPRACTRQLRTRSCWTPSGASPTSTPWPSTEPATTSAVSRSTSSLAFFSSVATTLSPTTQCAGATQRTARTRW